MSGGHWNYKNDTLMDEIFGYNTMNSAKARHLDPFEDPEISELVFDVFSLIHDADWFFSGDDSEDTYRQSIEDFKKKWLKPTQKERVQRNINAELDDARKRLQVIFNIMEDDQ